jgi:secreted trypsin-like serine protease
MRRIALALVFVCCVSPAIAMVGGAAPADSTIARHVVLIVGSRGTACTGVVIARDLILTVAHCAQPDADYKWVSFDGAGQPTLNNVTSVTRHPQFDLNAFVNHRATADVALMKLPQPLPSTFAAAQMAPPGTAISAGQKLLVAGYGLAVPGNGKSGGKLRAALLTVTGQPGTLQIRLVDPQTNNSAPGLGGCTGDSGAPAFDVTGTPNLVGLVSWTTAARNEAGCGGLTGVTPLTRYHAWIVETAGKLGLASQ